MPGDLVTQSQSMWAKWAGLGEGLRGVGQVSSFVMKCKSKPFSCTWKTVSKERHQIPLKV